jgi:hypothetical protein
MVADILKNAEQIALKNTERGWFNAWQTLRSETCNRSITWNTARRFFVGLNTFPLQPLSILILPRFSVQLIKPHSLSHTHLGWDSRDRNGGVAYCKTLQLRCGRSFTMICSGLNRFLPIIPPLPNSFYKFNIWTTFRGSGQFWFKLFRQTSTTTCGGSVQ